MRVTITLEKLSYWEHFKKLSHILLKKILTYIYLVTKTRDYYCLKRLLNTWNIDGCPLKQKLSFWTWSWISYIQTFFSHQSLLEPKVSYIWHKSFIMSSLTWLSCCSRIVDRVAIASSASQYENCNNPNSLTLARCELKHDCLIKTIHDNLQP